MTDVAQPAAAPPSPATAGGGRYDAFLSYSRKDREAADGLAAALEERGKDVWLDVEDILAGADWRARIQRGIEACTAFVFLLSPDSLASEHCRQEVELAAGLNKLIIPVLLREVDERAIPPVLADREWVFLRERDASSGQGLERLVEALETDLNWRDEHTRLAGRTREWLDAERDKSFLLRGSELREAELWLATQASHRETATGEQAEYIVAGRRAATARQRTLLTAVGAGLAVAVGLAIFAFLQRNEAIAQKQAALSRGLIAESQAAFARDPSLAGALSIEAYRAKPTFEARASMLTLLAKLRRSRGPVGTHGGRVYAVAFHPDARLLATASADESVRLWDVTTHREVATLNGHDGEVHDVAFSRDGRLLASGAGDGSVRIWDPRGRRQLAVLAGHEGVVRTVAFSPDGRLLASAGDDRTIRLWDVERRRSRGVLGRHADGVQDVAFDDTGRRLVSGGLDATVRIWDVVTRRQIRRLAADGERIHSVAFSRDGRSIAGGSAAGTVLVWDGRTGRSRPTLRGHRGEAVRGLAFDPRGRLVSAGDDGTLRLWDPATARAIGPTMSGHDGTVHGVAFSADGRRLASAGADRTVRLWDVSHDESLVRELRGHRGAVTSVAFGRSASALWSAGSDGAVVLWDRAAGRPARTIARGDGPLNAIVVRSDDGLLATAGESGGVRLGPASSGRTAGRTLPVAGGVTFSLAFDRRGRTLASGNADATVGIWDVRRKRGPASLPGHRQPVTAVDFDPSSSVLASASIDGSVRLWDTAARKPLGVLGTLDDQLYDVAFSPDGAMVATAGRDGTVQLWDVGARRPDGPPLRTDATVALTVAFSPDGSTLAVGDQAGRLRLWDVGSRRELGEPLSAHTDDINAVAFAPRGRLLASASTDGTVRAWDSLLWSDGDDGRLQRAICARVWRNLSAQEQRAFPTGARSRRATCPDM